MISRAVRRRTLAEWLEVLDRTSVPVAPVLTVPEALADPQLAARQHRVTGSHAGGEDGALFGCAPAALVSQALSPAPDLGADTDDVLASLDGRSTRKG